MSVALLSLTQVVLAQVAIIQDPDGFTNVRSEANANSKVIYKINEDQVFWIDYVEGNHEGDWIPVFVPKNKYSQYDSPNDVIHGFVHKSRILTLDKLDLYTGSNLRFKYINKPFDATQHYIEYLDGTIVKYIDGQKVWGADGNIPKLAVERIDAELNGVKLNVSPALYSNLYECSNAFKIYEKGDIYFLYQGNSDGAGWYEVVWVIADGKIVQRLVGNVL